MKLSEPAPTPEKPSRDFRLTAINFVADAVNRTLDLKEIADDALHAVLAVMNLDAGAVYLWQEGSRALQLFAHRGLAEALARQVATLREGENTTIDAVLDGHTRVIADTAVTPDLFRPDVARAGFRSGVLTPIRTQGVVVGALALGTYKPREFSIAEIDLIEVIATQIGNAMMHAQLQIDLRASEEQYRSLVENSDDAIYIVDSYGRPRFANSAFPRMFGFTVEELADLEPWSRVHPDDAQAVQAAFAKLMQDQPVQNLEYRFCRKDGKWIDLQCNASVFSREGDRVEEVQFAVREVTEARQRQHQLIRRNRQLAALTTLAEVANSSLRIEEIARNTLQVAIENTGLECGAIHLADLVRPQLNLYVHIGLPDELVAELRALRWGEGIAGVVAANGQAKICSDMAAEPAAIPAAVKHGFRAIIVVPVRAKGELLGTLALVSKRELQFSAEVIEMVTAMGNQLGIALANARLFTAQLRENEKLNALLEISSGSAQRLELDPLLQRILERSSTLLKADAAYIVRYDAGTNLAEVVAVTPTLHELLGTRFPASQGLIGQIGKLRQGKIFTGAEVAEQAYGRVIRQSALRSVLAVPLMSRNELLGTLSLTRGAEAASDFGPADLELMEAFASRAAVAIDNAQLLKDLERKNRLLQLLIEEAHHRIKNNLQMISGLLQLEADVADPKAAEHLRTANSRLQAIAKVHNMLSSEMPEKVDAQALITTIAHTLTQSAQTRGGPPSVELDLVQLWLSAEQAVALALVVNELIANSLLHGRPCAGEALRLRVQCKQDGDQVSVTVCDNGGGFHPNADDQDPGQGMNIVAQLAQVNLRGSLQIQNREAGVCAELRFAVGSSAPPPSSASTEMAPSTRA